MKITRNIAVFAVSMLVIALMAGCSENPPNAEMGGQNIASDEAAAIMTSNEVSLIRSAGVNLTSGKGIFTLGWKELFNPKDQTSRTMGNAIAVGFADTSRQGNRPLGIDMGNVSLAYGNAQIELQKRTGPKGGVTYSSFTRHRGDPEAKANVEFVSGGTYTFNVSGSEKFKALSASLTAPASLLKISSHVDRQSVSRSADLNLVWSGGNSGGVLVAIMPGMGRPGKHGSDGPPQGPGGMHGRGRGGQGGGMGGPHRGGPPQFDSTKAIVIRLEGNPGSYTVAGSLIQDLITRTEAKALVCTVSQLTLNNVEHDGGTVNLVLRNGDAVHVKVE